MRLVRRLTAQLLLVVGVVLSADTYLSIRQHLAIFDADLRRDERLLGGALAHAVERVWRDNGEEAALDLVRGADEQQDGVGIRLVFLDHGVDSPLGPDVPVTPQKTNSRKRTIEHVRDDEEDERLYTYAPLSIPGEPHAVLELSASIAHERAYLAGQIQNRLVTASILFATCALVAWIIGARVVGRPIERLVQKARRIGLGDFANPLELRQRDEITHLGSSLESMSQALAQARRDAERFDQERLTMLEHLRHADRLASLGRLAGSVAHELGTPLNVVSGRARMIADGELDSSAEITDAARIIGDQAERMTLIVRQLLDVARKKKADKREADLAQLTEQVVALLAPLAAEARVELDFVPASEPVLARADRHQLQQAITNLVMNAIQAARDRGRVSVSAMERTSGAPSFSGPQGRYAVIEVVDDGVGIPPENLPAIFDPFFTTRTVGEGTGLGLAVAQGIVVEHGGRIEVRTEPGNGSVFQIWLPSE